MRRLVWTIREEGRREPFLCWVHEGPQTAAKVEDVIELAKDAGMTVIVGLSTKRPGTIEVK